MGQILRQGRKQITQMVANVAKIKTKLKKDPFKPNQKVARELQIHEKRVTKVVNFDEKAKSRAQVQKHLITQVSKEMQLEKTRNLLIMLWKKKPVILLFERKKFLTCTQCPTAARKGK
jgi:hypothetical protein